MARNELDEIDNNIISALREDGRMSFAEIARRNNVSAGMIRERYLRLIRDDVLKVVAVSNLPVLNDRKLTLIGIKVEGSQIQEIINEIAALDEVIYLAICTGRYDIMAEVVYRDNAELLQFLTKRLRTIKGIRDTESFDYLDVVKEVYV